MSKARLATKNKAQVLNHLQLRITRLKAIEDEVYRDVVRDIFLRVLNQTPQYSGRLVESWGIGVGAPATIDSSTLGDQGVRHLQRLTGERQPKARGHRTSIRKTWERERGKIATLTKGKAVYLTNSAWGDTDNGKASPLYLEALQDPSYARAKLRAVNQPYELVADSVAYVAAKWRNKKINPFRYTQSVVEGEA